MSTSYDTTKLQLYIDSSDLETLVRDEAAVCAAKRIAQDPTAFGRISMTAPEETFMQSAMAEAADNLVAAACSRYVSGDDGTTVQLPPNANQSAMVTAANECDKAIVAYVLAKWYQLTQPDLAEGKMAEYARHVANVQNLLSQRVRQTYSVPTQWLRTPTKIE